MIRTCITCGQLFIPEGGERRCEDCQAPRTATITNVWNERCEIVESKGRCEEYVKGKCENCLDYCASENWLGWRKKNGSAVIYEMSNERKMQIWKELFGGEEWK